MAMRTLQKNPRYTHGMKNVLHGARKQWAYLVAGAAAATLVCGVVYLSSDGYEYLQAKEGRDACRNQFPLINRSLGCTSFDENSNRIHSLGVLLDNATELYVQNGKATRVSIFVRDLISQQWAASNENEVYAPASLMKLPLLFTYYKIAELDSSIFDSSLTFTATGASPSQDDEQSYVPADRLVLGKAYTVRELIKHMIVNSDNDAADLLYKHINPAIFDQTVLDLGLQVPTDSGTVNFVTVKTYAGVIRMLYNSNYLSRESSQEVLELMTETAFPGIATPIPKNVQVAHKFGEREIVKKDRVIRQLHDCGIVYKDPHPYILCIMTEGENFDQLNSTLVNVSELVYKNL